MLLSVIVPLYNEEEIVEKTFRVLEDELKEIEHEIIFVNDGSKDKTREILEKLLLQTPHNKSLILVEILVIRRRLVLGLIKQMAMQLLLLMEIYKTRLHLFMKC